MTKLAFLAEEAPRCKCGCGKHVERRQKVAGWKKYADGHWHGRNRPALQPELAPLCACGCGKRVTRTRNRWPRWLKGHHTRKHGFDPDEAKRNERLLRVYGITRGEYDAMVLSQGDCCAVCRTEDKGSLRGVPRKMWCVDHDHVTGKVRGLLCPHCNTAIGLLHDDVDLVQSIADYLWEHLDVGG